MQRPATPPPADIPAADLARVKELYLHGRYRAALDAGAAFGPLRGWAGPAARLLAGRLAMQLGAPALGRQLHLLAFRESPAYPEAVYYHARHRLERFGPFAAWRFMREHTDWSESSPELRADWAALGAFVAARLRDFDRADALLAASEAASPDRPWHFVERSSILELQEKYDDALASARKALALQPWFRPGVQAAGQLLARQEKDGEAVVLLAEACDRLESGMVAAQLAALQMDLGRPADARASLDRFADLSPLMEPEVAKWLAARRADVAYLLGEYPAAAEQAKLASKDDPFYAAFAGRLETISPDPAARAILPLGVAHDGSPPSAADLLTRFWNQPPLPPSAAPPMQDGVPDPADRRRLEAAGWACREFTLTFDAARELIAAKRPFLLTLVEIGFSQPRLVIGVDAVRESLFLAEAGERKPVEAPMAMVRERFAATGPRCLVAVPPAHAAVLSSPNLPDAGVYDRLYSLVSRAAERRFAEAKADLDALTADSPGHPVAKVAALAWAKATQHPVLTLEAVNALLEAHPADATFLMAKSNVLRELGRVRERTALLAAAGTAADADPILMQSYAQVLLTDPHRQELADRLLRRSVRLRPNAPAGYFLLSAHRWEHRRFDEAVDLHRMACCLDEREEQFAEAYVRAAKATGKLPEAVRLLQRRATKGDAPTPAAVRALHAALVDRGEPEFAATALAKAIDKLAAAPGHEAALAEVRLFAAETHAAHGRYDDAGRELDAARAAAPPALWHKAAARVDRTRPRFREALRHLHALLAADPLDADAQRLAVGLLADTEGKPAARDSLADLAARFPHVYPLLRLRAEFLTSDADDDSAVAATQALIALCPRDAWAHRQLALVHGDRRRNAEALAAVQAAAALEPDHPSQFAVHANVRRRADQTDEAVAAFKAGLALHVDHELAIAELVRTARGVKEKKAALRFVREQLREQPTTGEGLVAYRDQALPLADDPEDLDRLFADLEGFLDDRPDLWQAWSLVVQQMVMTHRGEEAYSLAKDAVARFPLLSRLWLDLAEACRHSNRPEERIDALRRAAGTAPGWTPPVKELSDALAEAEEFEDAVAVLERHVVRSPMDPLGHGFLAERLWNADRGEEAFAHVTAAVRHEPGYDWAWGAAANWGERLDRPDAVAALARDLAADRGGDPRVFMKLARSLFRYEQTDEALAALDRAVALDPKNPEPYDLKAERLADVGRFDEAVAATAPPALSDDLPLILQGRAAWVEAKRGQYARAIPMMQALVSVDPGYYWGWAQLAEWYNETGKTEAYLEAANELIRLRPDHPTPLTHRGEARIQAGDRAGGKEDLREALRIHNGYSPAAALLFDACLEDGELREARTALSVLQEHMTGPEVLVKQLSYAVRTEDEDAAARAFADICTSEGEGPPAAMQAALAEMKAAGYEEKAVELMGDAWRSGDAFNPWAGLFWLDTPAGEEADAADRLAACDAVTARYPTFIPGYDRKAEQLARLGRYDEAAAVCGSTGLTPTPLTLRGRAAWAKAQAGEREEAIALMAACLDEDPDYTWGWRQLAHWYDDLGRHRDCLRAADHLVRLAPNDAYAYGIRGEAKRILGDHRGARDDYQRAFDLDPNFDAAGHQLISEQLATDDLPGATRTLAALRESADGPLLKLRSVQLAARQKNLTLARSALRALATDDEVPRPILRDAAKALDAENWAAEADDELGGALDTPEATPAAAGVWAERHISAGRVWRVTERLKELTDRRPDVGREAVLVYAWAMAVTGQPDTATATIQRYADLIRRTDDGWGRAAAALAEARQYPLATAWLQDWETREGCEPWMLRALADSHRALRRDADSEAALRAANALAETRDADLPDDLRAWLALTDALGGRADEAAEHLDRIDRADPPAGVALLVVLADALLAVRWATGGADKAKALADAKGAIRGAAAACPKADRPVGVGHTYLKVVDRLAADAGGLRAKAWALWQKVRPLVTEG